MNAMTLERTAKLRLQNTAISSFKISVPRPHGIWIKQRRLLGVIKSMPEDRVLKCPMAARINWELCVLSGNGSALGSIRPVLKPEEHRWIRTHGLN
jgi:hypothetical protein